MKQIQKEWLAKLDADVLAQKNLNEREMQKQATLAKLARVREDKRNTIGGGGNQQVVDGKGNKQKTVDYKNHDQTEEFDLDEQRDGFRLANAIGKVEEWDPVTGTQKQFQQMQETGRIVDEMVREMQDEMTDELDASGEPVYPTDKDGVPIPGSKPNRVPLFSKEDIATEVYDPMRRRGLIGETAIPDDYSRTKEMLKGSFDAYADRLKKDKKGLGKRLFDENIGLAKTMGTSMFTIASQGVQLQSIRGSTNDELATSWKPDDNIKSLQTNLGEIPKDDGTFAGPIDIAATRMGFAGQAMSFVTDVGAEGVSGLMERFGGKVPPAVLDRMTTAPQLALTLVAVTAAELAKPFAAGGLAMELSATLGTLVDRSGITKLLQEEAFTEKSVAEIGAKLGAACKATLLKLEPGVGDSTQLATKAGSAVVSALATKPDAAKVLQALASGKLETVPPLFAAAVEAALAGASSVAGLAALVSKDPANRMMLAKAADAMDEAFAKDDDPVPPEVVEDHKRDVGGHAPRWVRGSGGWVCETCEKTNTEDPEIFAGVLEAKIARLKRDQALLKWGATLVGLGIDTAANFVAPLAIAGCALKMAKNLYEAGTRTRDMVNFMSTRQSMFNAASAFSAPVSKFINDAAVQQAHYYANAAFEAAKMIGAIVQCSGAMAAPAGAILSAAATITQATEAVLYEAAKRLDLEVAWSAYKKSLSRPENRKLGLIALKRNPTLAKYAVAWGAVIKGDPLVADFMSHCGLTPEALKDPDAQIPKVVEYLETRMPDDNVVTGRTVDGPQDGWAPATIALTVDSWMAAKARGESRGGMKPQDTRSFEVGLLTHARSWPAWQVAGVGKTMTPADYKACRDLLNSLDQALFRVSRLRTDDTYSTEMDVLAGRYRKLITDQIQEALAWDPTPAPVTN